MSPATAVGAHCPRSKVVIRSASPEVTLAMLIVSSPPPPSPPVVLHEKLGVLVP